MSVQAASQPPSERRQSLRFPCKLDVVCKTGGGRTAVAWPAQLRNVSPRGAGLVLPRQFSPGTQFRVCAFLEETRPFGILARVVHCNADRGGCYHGCAFLLHLDDAEFQSLVGADGKE